MSTNTPSTKSAARTSRRMILVSAVSGILVFGAAGFAAAAGGSHPARHTTVNSVDDKGGLARIGDDTPTSNSVATSNSVDDHGTDVTVTSVDDHGTDATVTSVDDHGGDRPAGVSDDATENSVDDHGADDTATSNSVEDIADDNGTDATVTSVEDNHAQHGADDTATTASTNTVDDNGGHHGGHGSDG